MIRPLQPELIVRILLAAAVSLAVNACSLISPQPDPYLSKIGNKAPANLEGVAENESEAFYNFLVGEMAIDQQDYDTAQKSFAKASQLIDHPSATIHEKLAEMYVRSGKLEEAKLESQRLLQAEPDNVEYQLLHAGILESIGELDQAIKIYQSALVKFPERIEIFVLLANAHVKQQDLPAAEKVLKQGAQSQPTNLLMLYNLGRISEAQKKHKEALGYYIKTFELDRQNPLVVPDVIRNYLELQDYDASEKFARKVLDNQPHNVLARKFLSQLLLGKSEVNEALEQFSALEDMQESLAADTRLKIARIQINAQNHPEAMRQLLLVLAEDPENDEARFYLASLYAGAGRITDAFTEVKKIKPGDKFHGKALVFEGFLWRQEGNSAEAERCFREIQSAQPNDVKLIYYLIAVLKDRKDYKEADKFFIKALELKPDNERLLFQHAVLLHEMGRDADSMQRMQEVLLVNPDNTDALNFVAFSLAENGVELDRALEMIERATKLTPNDPYYIDTWGWILFKRNNFEQAEKKISSALEQLPSDPEINEHYADVLVALGNNARAFEYYKKVIELLDTQEKTETDLSLRRRVEKKIADLEKEISNE